MCGFFTGLKKPGYNLEEYMSKAPGSNYAELKNGVVLAELGGYGDGPYCAKHGAGTALVMMGTYIVDPGR